jgi:hypothetical protein
MKMGTIVGLVVGYAFGTRAGKEGWTEIKEAWKVIVTSQEVRDLVGGGFALLVRVAKSRGESLSKLLGSEDSAKLRTVA